MLQKWMACYKPGYNIRSEVREGQFLPETEFLKSPSPSLFPRMVGGGVRAHGELHSPVSGRGQQVPGQGGGRGEVGHACSPPPFSGRKWRVYCPVSVKWAEAWLVQNSLRNRQLRLFLSLKQRSYFKSAREVLLHPWGAVQRRESSVQPPSKLYRNSWRLETP